MITNGKHLIIECRGAIAHLDVEAMDQLMQEAVAVTGATILSSHLHPFGDGHGVTGVLILAESHMTVHTWPEIDYAAFDLFVCGQCDPYKAIDVLKAKCPDSTITFQSIDRGLPRDETKSIDIDHLVVELCARSESLLERLQARVIAADRDEAVAALREVMRFLFLSSHNEGKLKPSPLVDVTWHELIIFTQEYAWVCQQLCGRFIDYTPAYGVAIEVNQYLLTLDAYRAQFGEPDPRFWRC